MGGREVGRGTQMRWAVVAALAGMVLTSSAARAEGIRWRSSVKDALAEAGKAGRLAMVNFYDKDCTWCERMDNETLSKAEVVQACDRVVPVRVDVDQAPDMAKQYRLEGVPSFVFLEASGAEAGRIEGFMPPEPFVQRLQEVVNEQDHVVALRKQISEKPDSNDAKADLARIYVRRRQGDMAAPLVDSLAALPKEKAPKDMSELLLGTAISFGTRGDNDKALVYLDKVTKGYPGTEEAEWAGFFTGLALGLKGDREAAIKQLEKVVATAKNEGIRERARMLVERFREEPPVPTL